MDVPDARVDRLSAMFKPRKTIYAKVTYADIAGLAKGVSEGGLSGPLLNTLSQSDALLHVVRAFDDPDVPHLEGTIDPCRDVDIVDGELLLSDLIIVERRIERLEAQLKKGGDKLVKAANEAELELFKRLHAHLETGAPLRDMDVDADRGQVAAQLRPAELQAAAGRAQRRRRPGRSGPAPLGRLPPSAQRRQPCRAGSRWSWRRWRPKRQSNSWRVRHLRSRG